MSIISIAPETVGIVLVNFNGMKFMPECLESLGRIDYPNAKIVVVDNASSDRSAEWVETNCPSVTLIRLPTNTGITGGNNAGIEWCRQNSCHQILLLNNDTVVEPEFLSKLMAHHEPNCLLVPKIYFHNNKNLLNNHLGSYDYWRGLHLDWFYAQPDSPSSNMIRLATMANTCALLIPSNIINQVGLMDERFFIYADDTDFITRAVRAGAKIKFIPDAVIYHKESSSSGGTDSPLTVYYSNRNRLSFMVKHQKSRVALTFFILYFSTTRILVALNYLLHGRRSQFLAMRNALLDFCLGRMGQASPSRFQS